MTQHMVVTPNGSASGPATARPTGHSASDAIQSHAVTRPSDSLAICVCRVVFHTATRMPTATPRRTYTPPSTHGFPKMASASGAATAVLPVSVTVIIGRLGR